MLIDNVSDDGIEQGIAQEFQTFVIQGLSFVVTTAYTLVHQSLTIVADFMGIETHDVIKRRKKLLLLAERELYTFYNILKPHTF